MISLGSGEANGGISILHALGIGKGCSLGIGLKTKVELLNEITDNPEDKHSILKYVMICWKNKGLPMPEKFGWKVETEIPIGQGLKSSSALACAAFNALNSIFFTNLDEFEIIDLAVQAQRLSGCTKSGSMDDSWSSISRDWRLVDPTKQASESVISKGSIEEDLVVIICTRGERTSKINSKLFQTQQKLFKKSFSFIEKREIFSAMTTNGLAVAAILNDHEAIKICNMAIISGAISAGISGSGPAIAIVCYDNDADKIQKIIDNGEREIIKTTFIKNINK